MSATRPELYVCEKHDLSGETPGCPECAKEAAVPKEVINLYWHCKRCLEEMPAGESPRDYQRIQVGWTKQGVQAWCVRHDMQVVHLDFLGQKVSYA